MDAAERKRCWALPGWGWGLLPSLASPSTNVPGFEAGCRMDPLHTGMQMSWSRSLADGTALDRHLGLALGLHQRSRRGRRGRRRREAQHQSCISR